ncbi:hypothetical protein Taro_006741, partial [Colocasia esculenta]|nr:hypothetical protein [Colocasia esculenta]
MGLRPCGLQARARRRFLYRSLVRSRDVAVLAQRLHQCSFSFFSCTSGLRLVRGRWTRVEHVTSLMGLDEQFCHSWYQSKAVVMAGRRDWGGGGDDPEESTQRMIERIWESLTDIRMRMDQLVCGIPCEASARSRETDSGRARESDGDYHTHEEGNEEEQ